ncbi:MAG: asparaginase, partial [Candidatus Puniceispirillaceae bacterium]
VYSVAVNSLGLGGMLKVRDGNVRAAEAGLGHLLSMLGLSLPDTLSAFFAPTLKNWAGDEIGRIAANIATQN